MEVDKHENRLLNRALDHWVADGKLDKEKSDELRNTLELRQNDRHQVAQYFFFISLFSILLAFAAIFLNEKLLERIKIYFSWSDAMITLITSALSVLWFLYIGRKRRQISETTYEIYMVLGGLSVLTSLVYLCKELAIDKTNTAFLSMAMPVLAVVAVSSRSRALWIGAIAATLAWVAAFTTWQSTNNLFLGMNYPVRYTAFGALLMAVGLMQSRIPMLKFTQRITFVSGLLLFFTGLWAVSIFGNYNSFTVWQQVRQVHVLAYSVAFGVAAAISFYLGIRYQDELARDLGVLFLLINLYTRYFEFFWNGMNKGLFFLVLAITCGFIGWFLEKKARANKKRAG